MTAFDDARAAVTAGGTPEDAAREVVDAMTPEERLWCLDGDAPTWAGLAFLADNGYHKAPFLAAQVDRLGVPGFAFSDGPRGVVIGNGTCFPVSMARGATWDPELEERVGVAIGRELRASGATLTGAVCINVLRHPAWGRAQETYGEDPFHVGEMAAAFTRGLQHHMMACVKHFACNSMENARFQVDITVDEVALHEVYLPHFKRVIDEEVASVMSAYNSVNGEWCGQSGALLTDVLRDEWGFDGFVISDWIFGMRDAAKSVTGGLDVEMPYRMVRATHLRAALDAGEVSWDDVDAAALRIVSTLLRFDEVLSSPPPADVIDSSEHRELAREVAARSVVLLRNEEVDGAPVLPLSATDVGRVAVLGRLADAVNLGDAGSSDVWALDCRTVLDGIRAVVGDGVTFHAGDDAQGAGAVAAEADVAIVVAGYTYVDEGEFIGATPPELGSLFPPADEPDVVERFQAQLADLPDVVAPPRLAERPSGAFGTGGDRTSLRLHPADVDLIRAVAAANRRTVVVVQGGSAVVVSEWQDDVAAIVQAWYAGSEAGTGLADVLFGDVNPSARLPFSVPSEESHLPAFDRDATQFVYDRWHGWWHLRRHGHSAAFPFGFGLSYTTFELGAVDARREDGAVVISGSVGNTGDRDGADVVQVYAELPDADAPDRLVGFSRVEVAAGQHASFVVRIPLERLATRDAQQHSWRPPSGVHKFAVARHACDDQARAIEMELQLS